jgi:23S rRNA pseudouridine2605 synthase/23S rRNA pseudouridine2604 synthase
MEPIRLSRRMALTGSWSRHEADKLISAGRVTVDGVVAVPGTKVLPEGGDIRVDGKPIGEEASEEIFKFHKPKWVLSSYLDPAGRTTLADFKGLSDTKMGYSGRLDYDSEGLMLFTADGKLIYKLQRSEYKAEKEYIVEIDRDISPEWVKELEAGTVSEGEQFLPCKVKRLAKNRYKVILTEGKKRQVRRMFQEAGARVVRLVRTRIATVQLDGLFPGELIKLSAQESEELRRCIELE